MKKFITFLALITAIMLIVGCGSQKRNPARWQEPGKVNLPPVAQPTVEPSSGYIGDKFSFSSELSYDPDGVIVRYLWDFNDGTTDTMPNPAHTFLYKGLFKASLTVWDDSNASHTDYVYVDVDSIYIQPPDTCDTCYTFTFNFYEEIRGPIKDIYANMNNDEGWHHFQIKSSTDKPRDLQIEVDGNIHYMTAGENIEFTEYVSKDTEIHISLLGKPAGGHGIYITGFVKGVKSP